MKVGIVGNSHPARGYDLQVSMGGGDDRVLRMVARETRELVA
jgi:hypothetical protein